MKIKMVGFKVGESRPTANKAFNIFDNDDLDKIEQSELALGNTLNLILQKSDFISIRRVDE